jgi:hypothetical protein
VAAVGRQARIARAGLGDIGLPSLPDPSSAIDDAPSPADLGSAIGDAAGDAMDAGVDAVRGAADTALGAVSDALGTGSGGGGREAGGGTPPSADEIYDQVVDRLRRQLLLEREQLGDLTGDYL